MNDKPLGESNYESFADAYAKHTPTKPHNAYYERPATRSLLPDVSGQRVLDAGCGPGHMTAELLDRGATVTAIDVTPRMVEIAREHTNGRAEIFRADLDEPLSFAEDMSYDGVLSSLVLDYIQDWEPVFREFFRVLKPGGWLLFSVCHPMMEYRLVRERIPPDSIYYDTELFDLPWTGFGEPVPVVRSWRRPFEAMIGPLLAAGFRLETLHEPKPIPKFGELDPERYDRLMKEPNFLCIRATR